MNKQKRTAYMFFIWAVFILTGCTGKTDTQMYLEAKTRSEMPAQDTGDDPDQNVTSNQVNDLDKHSENRSNGTLDETSDEDADAPSLGSGLGKRTDDTTDPATCFVYVCGAVKYPGVFELPQGSRIYEAIALAGGLRGDACAKGINQAGLIQDGDMIEILTEEEYQKQDQAASSAQNPDNRDAVQTAGAVGAQASDNRVDLNTADAAQLMTLSGIGEAKAAAIIAYREENGRFSDIGDIKKVSGIGDGLYARIKDKIKVT